MLGSVEFDLGVTRHFLGDDGQRAGFILLAGFLGSWLFIRTSARMIRAQVSWWPGNVQTGGGLHIHHLVWGICLMMISGFLGFVLQPGSPAMEVFAALFGVGMGLTLDEFALWLRLEDVYWSDEGRESVDAVVVAAVLGGLLVLGLAPFDVSNQTGSTLTLALIVLVHLLYVATCAMKGKVMLALCGMFIPLIALVGAIRLAKPRSPWARRLYKEGGRKLARAQARYGREQDRRNRFFHLIAGTPTEPDPPPAPEPQPKA